MHAFGNKKSNRYFVLFCIVLIPVMAGGFLFYQQGVNFLSESVVNDTPVEVAEPSESTPLSQTHLVVSTLSNVTPSPTIAVCRDNEGSIEYRELVNENFREPMSVRIYLPPCYGFDSSKHYPVLYILHGQSSTDEQWDHIGLDEAADKLISEEKITPLIIVMPKEPNSLADENESLFGEAIVQVLVPWVDEEYRVINSRDCRAIGGLSRGAAWSMRVGFVNWELFGEIGAHSFAPFSGDFYNFPYWLQEIPEGQVPRIYMDIGTQDFMLNAANLFEDRLTKYHVAHEWIINTGTHNEAYWSSHVEDYLLWYTFLWEECASEGIPGL